MNLNKILPKISIYKGKEDTWKFSNLNRIKSTGCVHILLCHPAGILRKQSLPFGKKRSQLSMNWSLQGKLLPGEGQRSCASTSRSG